MAYGLKVYNKFGEEVVDISNKHYYAYRQGTTASLRTRIYTDAYNKVVSSGFSGTITYISVGTADIPTIEFHEPRTRVAAEDGDYTIVSTSPDIALCHPVLDNKRDMVFYDVSTYGLLSSSYMVFTNYTDATPSGGFGVCEIEGNNDIGYTLVSTREPITSPTTNYGMQLFDSSGTRILDTRQDLFTIYDYFYVDRRIIQRIIEGGAYLDLTLSETHAGYRVASPNHRSFYTFSGGYRAQAMIKRLDDNTIRISQVNNGGSKTGTYRQLYSDTIIIVGV